MRPAPSGVFKTGGCRMHMDVNESGGDGRARPNRTPRGSKARLRSTVGRLRLLAAALPLLLPALFAAPAQAQSHCDSTDPREILVRQPDGFGMDTWDTNS